MLLKELLRALRPTSEGESPSAYQSPQQNKLGPDEAGPSASATCILRDSLIFPRI